MAPRKKPNFQVDVVMVLLTVGGALCGAAINMYSIANQVATKPYVDEGLKAAKIYTDDKSAQVLKDAIAHADRNAAENRIRMEQYHAEVRAQGAQVTQVLETVKEIQREGVKSKK